MFRILAKEMFSYKIIRTVLVYIAVIVMLMSISAFTNGFLNALVNVVILGITLVGIAFVVEHFKNTGSENMKKAKNKK